MALRRPDPPARKSASSRTSTPPRAPATGYPDRVVDLGGGTARVTSACEAVNFPMYATNLWRSDGTEAGTFIVSEINPGGSATILDLFLLPVSSPLR